MDEQNSQIQFLPSELADRLLIEEVARRALLDLKPAVEKISFVISNVACSVRDSLDAIASAFGHYEDFLKFLLQLNSRRKDATDLRRRESAARYRRRKAEKRKRKAEWRNDLHG